VTSSALTRSQTAALKILASITRLSTGPGSNGLRGIAGSAILRPEGT